MPSGNSFRVKVERPEKVDMFMFLAWSIKELSMDGQTKHGCVITNKKNRILGMGYNSFPREMDNESLPNLRDAKYQWMIHAEANAVNNCTHKPEGGIAYVTGFCCKDCIKILWQSGVDTVYQMDRGSDMTGPQESEVALEIVNQTKLVTHIVKPDFTFSKRLVGEAMHSGFVHDEFRKHEKCFEDMKC